MILGGPKPGSGTVTLHDLVSFHASQRPDARALIDAPDRAHRSKDEPRQFTWRQIERSMNCLAAKLRELGLAQNSVVLIQGPNSSDILIAILACARAGLIAAMAPLAWGGAEAARGAHSVGARAIITVSRAGPGKPADILRDAAREVFSVRFVGAFGAPIPQQVVDLNACINPVDGNDAKPEQAQDGNPADHAAILTFDASPRGYYSLARSHNELLAAGLAVVTSLKIRRASRLLSTFNPATLAGLATGLLPWLMTGCSLILHQAFAFDVLDAQLKSERATHLILPHSVLGPLAEAQLFSGLRLEAIASVVRQPGQSAPPGKMPARITYLHAIGETGIFPAAELVWRFAPGPIALSVDIDEIVLEVGVTRSGILALRGAMVPRAPLTGHRGEPYPLQEGGWVLTNFPARLGSEPQAEPLVEVTGSRPGVICIGGLAIPSGDAKALFAALPEVENAKTVALPHPLLHQRIQAYLTTSLHVDFKDLIRSEILEKHHSPLYLSSSIVVQNRLKRERSGAA